MIISKKLVKETLVKLLKIENTTNKNFDREKALLEKLLKEPVLINENFVAGAESDDEKIVISNAVEQNNIEKTIEQIDAEFELYK